MPRVPRRLVILPSPLLGPASYAPLASSLTDHGSLTVVAPLPEGGVTPERVLDLFRSTVAESGATLLLAHSNAGYYAPIVADELGLPTIFMDAALPVEDASQTVLAPTAFAGFVASLPIRDGLLPPWPLWWDRADIAQLVPDEHWLDLVTREAPRLAPTYFTTPIPVPRGWDGRPAAYLGFGDTYAAELAFAERAGWVVRREDGHHLTHLAEPCRVADIVLALCSALHLP